MGKRSDFINDGYTEEGYIAAVEGLYESMRFSYRPYLSEERARVMAPINAAKPENRAVMYMQTALAKLQSWDQCNSAGEPLALTLDNLKKVRIAKLDRLTDIVLGFAPTDIDPKWAEAKQVESAENDFEAALKGVSVGQLTEEANEKN